MSQDLAVFEKFNVRRRFDEEKQKWFFSVIDVIAVLTDQEDYSKAKSYWSTLKSRLKKEGGEVVTNCDQPKKVAK
jgi:DNA-damage-inducible protein D